MKTSEKISKCAVITVSVVMSVFGVFCVYDNFSGDDSAQGVQLAAAGIALPDGIIQTAQAIANSESTSVAESGDTDTSAEEAVEAFANTVSVYTESLSDDTDLAVKDHDTDSDTDESVYEQTYLVTECLYRESNMSYNNFFVRNATELDIDIGSFLNAELPYSYEDTTEPQVLIVHTHATESYMDEDLGYYYESFYPRDTDDNYNVVSVGAAIAESLESAGIGVIHCTTHHDDPQYYGAYDNSAESILEYLEEYPGIKIVLDIHRDSITADDGEKTKPTFVYNGKKAAQIMIMCGNDNNGYYDFDGWEDNMALAVKLQSMAETKYPGMTRPLYFGNFMYNMNLAPGSLLIEVGTDANTLDEAQYSGELLGNVIAAVLKETEKE